MVGEAIAMLIKKDFWICASKRWHVAGNDERRLHYTRIARRTIWIGNSLNVGEED